jgi:hypothetical protein
MKSDADVGHLLGHAAKGFGEQREVGGADAALVVQTPQPPLGPVDEVGDLRLPAANPRLTQLASVWTAPSGLAGVAELLRR